MVMTKDSLSQQRQEYKLGNLRKDHMHEHPLRQLQLWYQKAIELQVPEPNAMTLATVDHNGQPSIRVVLVKDIDLQGLTFFTNYKSRKGLELANHPLASLNFFWQTIERQVRVNGTVEQVSSQESDDYFKTRPRGSQIGAWVSPQSEPIPNRLFLEHRLKEYQDRFEDQEIPRPPHWGGYIIKPRVVEFWQGRPNRLHDRMLYEYKEGQWSLERLAP